MYPYIKGKNVLLLVSSGIAIYKAVDLSSKLRKIGVNLNIILSENAKKMIHPSVFSAVANCNVYTDTYEDVKGGWIPHTELSREADVLIVAPATTNTIAKINAGIADNLLTTTAAAFNKEEKIIVATMNTRMFENPINIRNMKSLESNGWKIMYPDSGVLACGEVGMGRYPDNDNILDYVDSIMAKKDFLGKKILITAGPTSEPIDPVRTITNNSSGKMGYELAKEFSARGGEVILVSGKTDLKVPFNIKRFFKVQTASEMYNTVKRFYEDCDIFISAAAISDYKVKNKSDIKIKKQDNFNIELEKNIDILKAMGEIKKNQINIGFAAETNNVIDYAKNKLNKKNADLFIANDVSRKDIGFDSNENEINIISQEGETCVKKADKRVISMHICDFISNNFIK